MPAARRTGGQSDGRTATVSLLRQAAPSPSSCFLPFGWTRQHLPNAPEGRQHTGRLVREIDDLVALRARDHVLERLDVADGDQVPCRIPAGSLDGRRDPLDRLSFRLRDLEAGVGLRLGCEDPRLLLALGLVDLRLPDAFRLEGARLLLEIGRASCRERV